MLRPFVGEEPKILALLRPQNCRSAKRTSVKPGGIKTKLHHHIEEKVLGNKKGWDSTKQ